MNSFYFITQLLYTLPTHEQPIARGLTHDLSTTFVIVIYLVGEHLEAIEILSIHLLICMFMYAAHSAKSRRTCH